MNNLFLYVITVLVWGSTWIAIKFQLGIVDPMVSVCYRFAIAAVLLIGFCYFKRLNMRFTLKEHGYMALFGALLFSINYWLVYVAEIYITSGLVAVLFTAVVFMNIANGAIFLKSAIRMKMVAGAFLGTLGICLIFYPEIQSFDLSDKSVFGLSIGMISVLMASFGNILSARNQQNNLPVIQANAFGMAYGAGLLIIVALVLGKPFQFSFSVGYISSLFYLSVFGSIIAFGSYLTLIGNIGADKASYAIMVVPVVALVISSFVEDYHWSLPAVSGLILVVAGNFLALVKKPSATG
ncbi:MAG: DMT family transporter [Desulfobacteraceae bacterium]|nr:MAG: DMT family transporter [Desulfobacteraceae bacterium]